MTDEHTLVLVTMLGLR